MDLALLVYSISVLSSLRIVSATIAVLSSIIILLSSINYLDYSTNKPFWYIIIKRTTIVFIVFLTLVIAVPSEKTMYTMVGAYAAQKVAEDPKVQQLSGKVLKLVETKLDQYIDEATTPKK